MSNAPSSSPATPPIATRLFRHTQREDVMALLTGSLFIAIGLALFRQAQLLSGGTAGIAFLAHYLSGWPLGAWFFAINLPFYWLAWHQAEPMGKAFTIKTFIAVALVSAFSELIPLWLSIQHVHPLFAALAGGTLIGCGLLILIRHRGSLGGVGIVALTLQNRQGISAGKIQMAVDCLIVLAACFVADWQRVLYSIAGAMALNLVLADNHRPGRYRGMS